MMTRWTCFFVAVCALGLSGCDLFGPEPNPQPADRVVVVQDPFDGSFSMDPVTVDSAWVANDSLYLDVGHSGGCAEHDFRLYGAQALSPLTIFPPQGSVVLSHDANGDLCEAYVTAQLRFDLTPVLDAWGRDYDGPAKAMIYVERNAASVRFVEVTVP
ncbi:MAG: hypothetical protein RhofKO_26530 [Rhodothermales bacterium]